MAPDRVRSLVSLCAAPLAIALSLPPAASATLVLERRLRDHVHGWSKGRDSMAAGDPEGQHTETYGFRSSCTSGKCIATIISGPPPSNPTVPQPVQFTWDGSSWTQVSDFQWDCMMPDTTIQWSPARSNVRYTPQANGTLAGVMHTDILSGPCQGWIEMDMTAERA